MNRGVKRDSGRENGMPIVLTQCNHEIMANINCNRLLNVLEMLVRFPTNIGERKVNPERRNDSHKQADVLMI